MSKTIHFCLNPWYRTGYKRLWSTHTDATWRQELTQNTIHTQHFICWFFTKESNWNGFSVCMLIFSPHSFNCFTVHLALGSTPVFVLYDSERDPFDSQWLNWFRKFHWKSYDFSTPIETAKIEKLKNTAARSLPAVSSCSCRQSSLQHGETKCIS